MRLLALDTSSDACSVALAVEDRVHERHVVAPREHTRILVPMIESVLTAGGVVLADLDGIVLGNGPGSFIGMRIGTAVAQGMAFATGLEIVPVSSLAAIAAEVFAVNEATRVLVAQDARMNEVYLGEFRRGRRDLPELQSAVRLHRVGAPIRTDARMRPVAAGGGWQRYPDLAGLDAHAVSAVLEIRFPRARYLLGLGRHDWDAGLALPPDELVPAYVRSKVAASPSEGAAKT